MFIFKGQFVPARLILFWMASFHPYCLCLCGFQKEPKFYLCTVPTQNETLPDSLAAPPPFERQTLVIFKGVFVVIRTEQNSIKWLGGISQEFCIQILCLIKKFNLNSIIGLFVHIANKNAKHNVLFPISVPKARWHLYRCLL